MRLEMITIEKIWITDKKLCVKFIFYVTFFIKKTIKYYVSIWLVLLHQIKHSNELK